MTTYLEVKQWVQNAIGDADGTLIVSADLLRYANAAQRAICRDARLLYKTVSGAQTLTSFDTYGGILMPTDFVIELEVFFGSPLVRLARISWDDFWSLDPPATGGTSQPSAYAMSNYLTGSQNNQRHMLFYPHLATGLTNKVVRVGYSSVPSTITADGDVLQIPDPFVEVMAWHMERNCKIQLDDYISAKALKQFIDERMRELTSEFMETSGLQNRAIISSDYASNVPWDS